MAEASAFNQRRPSSQRSPLPFGKSHPFQNPTLSVVVKLLNLSIYIINWKQPVGSNFSGSVRLICEITF